MGKSGTPSPPRGGNNLTLRFQVDQARRTHSHNNPHFSRDTFPVTENRRWDRAARDGFSLDTGQAQKPTGTRTCRKALRIFKTLPRRANRGRVSQEPEQPQGQATACPFFIGVPGMLCILEVKVLCGP